jgi:hypothetical protein
MSMMEPGGSLSFHVEPGWSNGWMDSIRSPRRRRRECDVRRRRLSAPPIPGHGRKTGGTDEALPREHDRQRVRRLQGRGFRLVPLRTRRAPPVRTSLEHRLAAMSADERAADAIELVERIRARLSASRTIEHEPEE